MKKILNTENQKWSYMCTILAAAGYVAYVYINALGKRREYTSSRRMAFNPDGEIVSYQRNQKWS